MKNKRFRTVAGILLSMFLLLQSIILPVKAGDDDTEGAVPEPQTAGDNGSRNRGYSAYNARRPYSFLIPVSGGYMRVQAGDFEGGFDVMYYDDAFQQTDRMHIAEELPVFGGFYAASDGRYYVVTGRNNSAEQNIEVIRITAYDQSWNRIASAGLYGANTETPFRAGSLDMTDTDGYLLIRTCHRMFKTPDDGLNHQANLSIQMNMSSMQITSERSDIANEYCGYVSHSFNQYIRSENGYAYAVDHGDAYPRGIILGRYTDPVSGGECVESYFDHVVMHEFPGAIGENYTGAELGGFEISSSSYLMAMSANIDANDYRNSSAARNIVVLSVPKSGAGFGTPVEKTITSYSTERPSQPYLVKISGERILLLWQLNGNVYYTQLDAEGNPGQIYEHEGKLSDCQPVVAGNKVVWYRAEVYFSDTPETRYFYTIDLDDLSDFTVIRDPASEPTPTEDPTPTEEPTPTEGPTPTEEPTPSPEPEGESGSMVIREDIYYEVMQKVLSLINEWAAENGIEGRYRLCEGLTKIGIERASEIYLMNGCRPNGKKDFDTEGLSVCGQAFRSTSRSYDETSYRTAYDSDAIAQDWFDGQVKRCVETNLRSSCCGNARDVGIAVVNHPGQGMLYFFYIGYDEAGEVAVKQDALNKECRIDFKSEYIRFDTLVPETLEKGQSAGIRILAHSTDESERKYLEAEIDGISFSSDHEEILTVTEQGVLKALKAGSAQVTITAPGYGMKVFTVTVAGKEDPGKPSPSPTPSPVPVPPEPEEEIEVVDAGQVTLAVKQRIDIAPEVQAAVTADYEGKLKYVSADKRIATVTTKGVVKGKAAGTTFISVYGKHYGRMVKLAEYKVGVTKPVLKFTGDLTYKFAALDPNDYITGLPEGQTYVWSIPSNSKAAWLSGDGRQILALKNGSVKVSCTIGEGKYAAKYSAVLKVKIPKAPGYVKLKEGKFKTVTLKNVSSYTPVEWSSNEGILITEIPKYNKVRIYAVYPCETSLTATVDGQEYVIPVIIQ